MWRQALTIAAVSVLVLAFPQGAITGDPGCRNSAQCGASDDTPIGVLCTDGPYDPCDNWIYWTLEFYRTGKQIGQTILFLQIEGSTFNRNFSSQNYDPSEDHILSGWAYVGPGTSHRLKVSSGGDGGHFENIWATLSYRADKPTGGDE